MRPHGSTTRSAMGPKCTQIPHRQCNTQESLPSDNGLNPTNIFQTFAERGNSTYPRVFWGRHSGQQKKQRAALLGAALLFIGPELVIAFSALAERAYTIRNSRCGDRIRQRHHQCQCRIHPLL